MRTERPYKNIFRPYVLENGTVLKNRICYSNGQQHLLTGPDKAPNEAMIDDVAVFARSGACLMTVGHFGSMGGGGGVRRIVDDTTRVVDECKEEAAGSAAFFDYSDQRTFNIVGQMAQAAHFYDTRILVKLGPSFPEGKCLTGVSEIDEAALFPLPEDERFDPVILDMLSPYGYKIESGDKPDLEKLRAKAATKEEIRDSIEAVAAMCMRYKNAGFDGTSIRGDRAGVNASTNIRNDEYGGSIENRGRYQLELYSRIKEICGPDFLIEVVMPGESLHGHDGSVPEGYTEAEFISFLMMIENVIDIVEIREPTGIGYQCQGYNSTLHEHLSLDYAKHLREAGFKKVIAVNGGYNDPDEMDTILGNGVVDLISTVRTFRAEPDFTKKLRNREVPVPCLRCNRCHGSYEAVCGCSVNPADALNHRLPLIVKAPARRKKIAVIGGGLIGMRAACFAVERGHSVSLFEKDSVLGGKAAYYGPMYPQLWPINRYKNWLIDELKRRNITDVRLNVQPEPEDIFREGYDAVIACTGSVEKKPPIPGADNENVWTDEDVYMGRVNPGDRVVIVGGGDVATETAMYLANLGKEVTVLTRQPVLMAKHRKHIYGPHMGNIIYFPELGYGSVGACWTKYENLRPVCNAHVTEVSKKTVRYEQNGLVSEIVADTVIVSGGYTRCVREALMYHDAVSEFYMAGDVHKDCGNLMLGNRYAYARVCEI